MEEGNGFMEVKNKIMISNIYLELTRACNLSCPHCLRGNADNDSFMTFEQIDRILDNFTICNHITMGGGEPCLAKEQMFYLFDAIRKRQENNISTWVSSVGMITNGTILDDEIVEKLNSLTEVLLKHIKEVKENTKVVQVLISNDKYHDNNPQDALKWYKERVNSHIRVGYNKLNKEKDEIGECKNSIKNGIKARKKYGIADLHRFSFVDDKLTTINDLALPILNGDCLAFTSKGSLIANGFYDFSEVDNPEFRNYMGNYMEEEVSDLIHKWNEKHPLHERHAITFEHMMRNALTEKDRDRIRKKFILKEEEFQKIKSENPKMNIFDIYKQICNF